MPVRIIIADDEPLQRMDLKDILTRRGYLVIAEATDGLSVVNLARTHRPDLVIMDIRMPAMDGITAAETLMKEKIAPVVLLTAYTDQALVVRARDAGVSNYLIKPLHESEVVPAIEVALARYNQFRAMEEQVRLLTEQLEARNAAERARGMFIEMQEPDGLPQDPQKARPRSIHEEAEAVLDELQHLLRGRLAIVISTSIGTSPVSNHIERYKMLYPHIELAVTIATDQVIVEKLQTQEVELAFLPGNFSHLALFTRTLQQGDALISIAYSTRIPLTRAAQSFLSLLFP